MTDKRWDVLGVGNSAVDELIYLDQFPQPDSKIAVREAKRQGGGLTATALVSAARQGARAAFCSLLGYDELSTFTLTEMEKEGIDCSPCLRSPEGVPFHSFILVEQVNHTRTILYERGRVELPPEHVTPDLIEACQVLFIDHHMPVTAPKAARIAREMGIPVVADLEVDRPGLVELMELIDHLIVSRSFAAKITGETRPEAMVARLASPGRACCVVTAGDKGCWYAEHGGEIRHQPAYKVDVVDTTGCGDVFHGAYAAALARGERVARAVQVASAAAAIKATQQGGRAGIPDLETVERFVGTGP